MPQIRKIEDGALIERLAQKFKDVGYEGASLSMFSQATGLTKSSLYHRFPHGKEQMAREVLNETRRLLDMHVLPMLRSELKPASKIDLFVNAVDQLYAGGKDSCLLNMLSPPRGQTNACGETINDTFHQLLAALAVVARQAGSADAEASHKAEQVLVEIQGALVVSRGMNDVTVFTRALARLPAIILRA